MIKLENVSALSLVKYCSSNKIQEILIKNHVLNFQDLENLCEKDKEVQRYFIGILASAKNEVERNNRRGKEPKIYTTPGYDEEVLGVSDMYAKGSDLLLWNPTSERYLKYYSLKDLSIVELKYLLSHTTFRGDNVLECYRGIGEVNIPKILEAIERYEKQVIRQANETKRRDIDLFTLNQEAKRELVNDNLNDIVNYLIDNTSEKLIWGKLNESQKKLLVSALLNDKKRDRIVKMHLIELFTNYMTLSELESGVTKSKVLNRFIEK